MSKTPERNVLGAPAPDPRKKTNADVRLTGSVCARASRSSAPEAARRAISTMVRAVARLNPSRRSSAGSAARRRSGPGKPPLAPRSATSGPYTSARRSRRWIPTSRQSCWQAAALTSASKTLPPKDEEPLGGASEALIAGRELVGAAGIDGEAQQPVDGRAHLGGGSLAQRLPATPQYDSDANRPWTSARLFTDHDLYRQAVGEERPRITGAVPPVDHVVRPTSQRPDGEVQAKRRSILDLEGNDPHRLAAPRGREHFGEHCRPRVLDVPGGGQQHEATASTREVP